MNRNAGKAGLIVNPVSGRASGKGLRLADLLRATTAVPVRVLDHFGRLEDTLREFAALGVDEIYISSGDGTLQAILTILAERSPFAALPRLAVLAHGTTNLTAGDLGFRASSLHAVAAAMARPAPRELTARPALRAANPRDGKPRLGMFLGTGAVWQAVVYCHKVVHRTGLKGNAASFATLAAAVVASVLNVGGADKKGRIDRAYPMTVRSGGHVQARGDQLLMLATTLEKLVLGTRPFWGHARAPLRVTVLPYPVPSLTRWMLPMMYGGEDRAVPAGAFSFSCDSFDVATGTAFVLDGEYFDPPAGEPLEVGIGPVFQFIRA